jgi:2-desacetyl-2-hydroxyethyl bacteriochlorophyllide A dehydrogenase
MQGCKTKSIPMNDTNATTEAKARLTLELVIPGLTTPEGLQVHERALPALAPREVLIAMEATGVSYAEVQMLQGKYPGQPAFPFVPGYDLVGRVVAVGPGGDRGLEGRRVATITGFGAWAQLVVRRAAELVQIPEQLDAAEVDTLLVNGVTAYKMLHRVARVRAGQTILVLGAGGGVGTILVQLARLAGVEVIGTCKPGQRAEVEALGAAVVDYTRGRVLEEVRALAPAGVDAVFDHVGGEGLRDSYALLRKGGALVCYGGASAAKTGGSPIWAMVGFFGRKLLWGFRAGGRRMTFFDIWGRGTFGPDHLFRPARFWREYREDLGQLLGLVSGGQLKPRVARRMPLLDAAAALAQHQRGGFTGKIVLEGAATARPS